MLWYLHISHRLPALAAMRFELLMPSVIAVVAAFRGLTLRSPLTPFVLFLLGCIAIQVPLSVDIQLSWGIFVDRVVKFVAIAALIASLVKGPRELKWFLAAFLCAMLKLGQEGFTGVYTGTLLWENQGVMRLHGPTPMYEHPNSFSGMAVGALPFVLFLWPAVNKWQKLLLAALGVFAVTIIVYAGSRAAYVASIGLLAFVVLTSKRMIRAGLLVSLVVAGALMFTPDQYRERFESIFTQQDKEGASTALRIEILQDSWKVFTTYPLGVGVGAFPVVREKMFGRVQDTHNLYLEVATNLGGQGFIAFGVFIGALLVMTSRLSKDCDEQLAVLASAGSPKTVEPTEHQADLRLIRQSAQAVRAFIVARLFLGFFGMDLFEIYWWFSCGLCVALYHIGSIAGRRTEALVKPGPPTNGAIEASPAVRPFTVHRRVGLQPGRAL